MKLIKKIEKWQRDRLLNQKPYDALNEHTNILEELMESLGYKVPKEKRKKLMNGFQEFTIKMEASEVIEELKEIDKHYKVDAYCDIVVFCIGAIMKLGYNPQRALSETVKEIDSRTGSIVDGKFQKDTSEEAKAKWYKANYDVCILGSC